MHPAPDTRPARRGFTILELMIAIGILATVMALMAESLASASNSASTITLVADLQGDAAMILDRIARDLRGARLPSPLAVGTYASSISYQPVPAFTSALDESNLFATSDTLTVSIGAPSLVHPGYTPNLLIRNRNGNVVDETLASNLPTTVDPITGLPMSVLPATITSQSLGLPAGLNLPAFIVYRASARSIRLYLALAGRDASGSTLARYAMIEVPTNN